LTISAANQTTYQNKSNNFAANQNPIKGRAFFAIPRQIAINPKITDRLFRLLAVLFSSFGDDGHIEFRISTLAAILQKGARQTKELIKLARDEGWIKTEQTGRTLKFFLTEKCYENPIQEVRKSDSKGAKTRTSEVRKPALQRCGNPHLSYHLEKKEKKETTASPPPESPAPQPSPPPKPKAPVGAAAAIKNIRACIDPIIASKVSNSALEPLVGKKPEHIRAASDEAMRSKVVNKVGLFMKLAKDDPIESRLKPASMPPNAGMHEQKCINCYNANVGKSEPTCSTIKPDDRGIRNSPSVICRQYCPFVLENKDLF
jgi:hypothetical protein